MTITTVDTGRQIERYLDEVLLLEQKAEGMMLNHAHDVEKALGFAFEAKALCKAIEEKKKDIIAPAKSFISSITKMSSGFTSKLESIEDTLLTKVDDWKEYKEFLPWDQDAEMKTESYIAYERETISLEVEDINLVPKEYLKIDEDAIKKLVKAGVVSIPGVRVERKSKTYIRAR